jgi:hypothetical protein
MWAGAGAVVAAALLFVAWPPAVPVPVPAAIVVPAALEPDPVGPPAPRDTEASVYTELTNFDHLANAVAEVKGRRDRRPPKRPAETMATKTGMKQG